MAEGKRRRVSSRIRVSYHAERDRYLSLQPSNHRPTRRSALERAFDRRRFLSGAAYGGAALALTTAGLGACQPTDHTPTPRGAPDTDPFERELALLAWEAETEELGIEAGPQDRVAQAHGGLLDMDVLQLSPDLTLRPYMTV